MEQETLRNRTALITGGSQGLGRALALSLARRGVELALVARGRAELARSVEAVRALGGRAVGIAADVGDKGSIHAIVHEAAAQLGPIDLLISCASTLGPTPMPLLLDTECEDLEHVLQVNLLGPFRLAKAVAGNMLLRDAGVVVHVSSDAAVEAYPGWGSYGLSKAALDHMTRTFAAELAGTGVRFFSVDPGEMDTRMHRAALPEADASALASPSLVAERIVALIADAERAPGGSRHVIEVGNTADAVEVGEPAAVAP